MGALQDYLKEVRKLKIVDAQPECLTFKGTIDYNGNIIFQSPSIRIAPGFMFACEQIKAGCPIAPPMVMNDAPGARLYTIAELLPYVSMNVLNEGMSKSGFKVPVPMSVFINSLGTTEGLKFAVPMTFFEGADISVQWFVDLKLLSPYDGTPSGNFDPGHTKETDLEFDFYVHLIGSIIRAETVL